MLCSEQYCVDDGQLLSGVYSNHVQRVFPFTTDSPVVRGSNAYFWANLESGSKVFFKVFSCYIGIVVHETA